MISVSVELDKSKSGKPRKLKDGNYRFALVLKDEEEVVLRLQGWRCPTMLNRVLPPQIIGKFGAYTLAEMSRAQEDKVLATIKRIIERAEDDESEDGDY